MAWNPPSNVFTFAVNHFTPPGHVAVELSYLYQTFKIQCFFVNTNL